MASATLANVNPTKNKQISICSLVLLNHNNKLTPRWIRLKVLPISRRPSGENAACHFLELRVLPACISK